jgi:hypothetical protein
MEMGSSGASITSPGPVFGYVVIDVEASVIAAAVGSSDA